MRLGCRGDDTGRRALLQPVEEELAEQKRRQVVDRPGQFDAVLRQLACSVHGAGVVDEHIQLWIAGQHLGGQSAHGGLRREIGDECRHRRSLPGRRPRACRRNADSSLAATDDSEVRAECGQRFRRGQPNAIGGTCDQNLLVVHGNVHRADAVLLHQHAEIVEPAEHRPLCAPSLFRQYKRISTQDYRDGRKDNSRCKLRDLFYFWCGLLLAWPRC